MATETTFGPLVFKPLVVRKSDFSKKEKANELFQRLHFLNILIEPDDLAYAKLLGFLLHFTSSGPLCLGSSCIFRRNPA